MTEQRPSLVGRPGPTRSELVRLQRGGSSLSMKVTGGCSVVLLATPQEAAGRFGGTTGYDGVVCILYGWVDAETRAILQIQTLHDPLSGGPQIAPGQSPPTPILSWSGPHYTAFSVDIIPPGLVPHEGPPPPAPPNVPTPKTNWVLHSGEGGVAQRPRGYTQWFVYVVPVAAGGAVKVVERDPTRGRCVLAADDGPVYVGIDQSVTAATGFPLAFVGPGYLPDLSEFQHTEEIWAVNASQTDPVNVRVMVERL